MDFDDDLIQTDTDEDTYIYIGRFDPDGFPIVTSRKFHDHASVALQAISLVALIAQTIRSEPLQQIIIRHTEGTLVCIEPNIDGYIAYLKSDSD